MYCDWKKTKTRKPLPQHLNINLICAYEGARLSIIQKKNNHTFSKPCILYQYLTVWPCILIYFLHQHIIVKFYTSNLFCYIGQDQTQEIEGHQDVTDLRHRVGHVIEIPAAPQFVGERGHQVILIEDVSLGRYETWLGTRYEQMFYSYFSLCMKG